MKVKSESEVAQSCPTLSDPMDHSLPGSSIHGIFQARVLERGAIAFSVPGGLVVKNSPASTGDSASIPDLERSYMSWSNYAHAPQLLSLCSRARELQLLSPHTTAPGARTPESLCSTRETTTLRSPCTTTREQPPLATAREKPKQQ